MISSRAALVAKFQTMRRGGVPIIGGGAGTGLSAKCEEAGGIDLIVIYNSGRFRMAGRGSLAGLLAYGDANAIVMDMAREVLPVVKHTPVLAGVNGTDPFRVMHRFLDEVKAIGFSGVQNFPTVGLIDGVFRENLEETGMSYSLEVDMIRLAREKELLTTPYVFCEEDAEAMAKAGADIIVAHLGLTTGGTVGAQTAIHLEDCPGMVDAWAAAALSVNPDVIVLVHGGPVAMPDDAAYVLKRTRFCHGFYGASSMERLPTEQAMTEQVRAFKRITLARGNDPTPQRAVAVEAAEKSASVTFAKVPSPVESVVTPVRIDEPEPSTITAAPVDAQQASKITAVSADERQESKIIMAARGDEPQASKITAVSADERQASKIIMAAPDEAPQASRITAMSADDPQASRIIKSAPGYEPQASKVTAAPADEPQASRISTTAAPLMRPAHVATVREERMDVEALRLYEEHRDIIEVFRVLHARGYPINDIAWKTGRSYQEVYKTIKEEERKKRQV